MVDIEENLKKKYDLAIILPTLNEETGLESTMKSINRSLEGKYNYIILVVDGQSTDGTVKVAKSFGAIVIQQRRRGVGDAIQTGLYYIDSKLNVDIIVMLDADGTYEPADIVKMVEIIQRGEADFVTTNRFANLEKGSMPTLNKIGNKILSSIARKTLGINVYDTQSGFRAFRADLANIFYSTSLAFPWVTEMLAIIHSYHIKTMEIPTSYHKRLGKTNLTPIRDGSRILSTIIRLMRDYRPLAFFGIGGVIMFGIGVILGYHVVATFVETGTVRQLPTALLGSLLIILGALSISVGLISDMIRSRTSEKRIFYSEL